MVAVFAPERRGGTNEIAVRATVVHTNRGDDDAHDREEAGHHGEPGQRDRFATIGHLEVDANGLGKRRGEGGGHHRPERGNEAGTGKSAESVGAGGPVRYCPYDDLGVVHAVHVVPPSLGKWRTGC